MADHQSLLSQVMSRNRDLAAANGWNSVRTLKDLAIAMGIEVAELQEILLWTPCEDEAKVLEDQRNEIEQEVADVFLYLLSFADLAGIDVLEAAAAKLSLNEERFRN